MKHIITGIYRIRNLINDKIYAGQSINIIERWESYKCALFLNKHLNKGLQNEFTLELF